MERQAVIRLKGIVLIPMTQAEIVRSMLIEVNGLIVEATNSGDRREANQLAERRDPLLAHLGALDCHDNLRAA